MSQRDKELRQAIEGLRGETELLSRLEEAQSSDELVSTLVDLLGERGFSVRAAELQAWLGDYIQAMVPALDDERLEAVAAGTAVNDQITDSVTRSNVKVIGDAPFLAMSPIFQQLLQGQGSNGAGYSLGVNPLIRS